MTAEIARNSGWQSLNKTNDRRISMFREFAAAVGVGLSTLVKE
jgi:hypothetical protein